MTHCLLLLIYIYNHSSDSYYQAALNLMPIAPAFHAGNPSSFYSSVIEALTEGGNIDGAMRRLRDDVHGTVMTVDSIAQASLAMYESSDGKNEVLFTPISEIIIL